MFADGDGDWAGGSPIALRLIIVSPDENEQVASRVAEICSKSDPAD